MRSCRFPFHSFSSGDFKGYSSQFFFFISFVFVSLCQSCQLNLIPSGVHVIFVVQFKQKGFQHFSVLMGQIGPNGKMSLPAVANVLSSDHLFFLPNLAAGPSAYIWGCSPISHVRSELTHELRWHLEEMHPWPQSPGVSYVTYAPSGYEAFPGIADKRLRARSRATRFLPRNLSGI